MNVKEEPNWDPIWEQIFLNEAWGKYPPEHVIRFVAQNFYHSKDRKKIKLLDLGCGTGLCTWFMAREGFSVYGIDGSASGLARNRERLESEGLFADLVHGEYQKMPWADETFDGCVDHTSLCCNRFDGCQIAVQEVFRVLKPGGKFLSANFSNATWGFGLGTMIEENGFSHIREGPLTDRGFALFMDQAQVQKLYDCFSSVKIEKTSWTLKNMEKLVELWVVETTR